MNSISEPTNRLSKISGVIQNYKSTRGNADFIFIELLPGLGDHAATAKPPEVKLKVIADYLEFSIDGQPIKGWVWRSPFESGDAVDVVGTWAGDHFKLVAIHRVADRTIAMYPHCSRGCCKHWLFSAFWSAIGIALFMGLNILIQLLVGRELKFLVSWEYNVGYIYAGAGAFCALLAFIASKKWMPFARLAENIFKVLDLPQPSNVDLVRSSKRLRIPTDPDDFGKYFFRY